MDDICEVIITGADAVELAAFTEKLIAARLGACGHQIAEIRALYRWEGAVHNDPEARLMLHTRTALVPEIVALADREHSYDVPCVIAVPVVAANPAYHRWVLEETKQP